MFEIVYDDGRTTDGRRLDGYPISSPCEPNGSGELKMGGGGSGGSGRGSGWWGGQGGGGVRVGGGGVRVV